MGADPETPSGPLLEGVLAIAAGLASTVALAHGNDQRSVGNGHGGPNAMGGEAILSYVALRPLGMTSQGALYAMMTQRYMQLHGVSSAGTSARWPWRSGNFASMNPNAIMRLPITIDDYRAPRLSPSPRALRLLLDQRRRAALILTTWIVPPRAPKMVVTVAGLGRAEEKCRLLPATSPDELLSPGASTGA